MPVASTRASLPDLTQVNEGSDRPVAVLGLDGERVAQTTNPLTYRWPTAISPSASSATGRHGT